MDEAGSRGVRPRSQPYCGGPTVASAVGGTSGLTKQGPGSLLLTGTNTFTGNVAVTGGTLALNGQGGTDPRALGAAGARTITLDGGTFRVQGGAYDPAANTKSFAFGANGATLDIQATRVLTLNDAGQVGAGSGLLTIVGGGQVTFGAANTSFTNGHTGNIVVDGTIAGTTLNVAGQGNADPTFLGAGAKSVTLTNGGRLQVTASLTGGFDPSVGSGKRVVIGSGGGTIDVGTGANVQVILNDANQFGGTGQFTKTGGGTLTIGGQTTGYGGAAGFTGSVVVNGGTLLFRNVDALGGGAGGVDAPITLVSGTLSAQIDGTGTGTPPTFATGSDVTVTGDATINVDRQTTGSNNTVSFNSLTIGDGRTLTATAGNGYQLTFTNGVTLTGAAALNNTSAPVVVPSFNGGGGAARTFTKSGAGLLTIAGPGTNFPGTSTFNVTNGQVNLTNNAEPFGPAATVASAGLGAGIRQVGAAAAGYAYTFSPDALLAGDNAFFDSLVLAGTGPTPNLDRVPETVAQTQVGGNQSLVTRFGLPNTPARYFGIAADLTEDVTVGPGSPWKGISSDRANRRLRAPTITANGDFTIQSLGAAILTLGNGSAAGTITLQPTAPVVVDVTSPNGSGTRLALDEAAPAFNGNVTFRINNNANLQVIGDNGLGPATTAAGVADNASVVVLAGGTLNPNGGAKLNGNVTIQPGGVLLLDDTNNLTSFGTITQSAGSVTRLVTNTGILGGSQSPGFVPGSVVRVEVNNVAPLDAAVPDTVAYVVTGGDRQFPAAGVTLSSTGAAGTGVLTNDASSRTLTSTGTAAKTVVTVDAGGATFTTGGAAFQLGGTGVDAAGFVLNPGSGVGPLTVAPGTTFQSNVANLIDARLVANGTARFQAATSAASSVEGGGSLILGPATGATGTYAFTTGHNDLTTTFAGVISQAAGGTGSLTKIGAGTLFLNGLNTFAGATTVTGGAVGGTGRLAGPLTVNPNGAVAPGASIGTLTVAGPVTFAGGTGTAPTLVAELGAGTAADVLALAGSGAAGVLTLTNPDALNLVPLIDVTSPTTYTIATFASLAAGGVFDAVTVNGAPSQSGDPAQPNFVQVSYNATDITVTVNNLSAVPEPGTVGVAAAAAAGLLARRRRVGR